MAKQEKNQRDQELFDGVIAETLEGLPADLKAALGTVQIVVQPRPSAEQLGDSDPETEDGLLGLFEGFSLRERPLGQDREFPDRIILFEECLRESCSGEKELKREIRKTLLHELGHYFGFSEEELEARGLE